MENSKKAGRPWLFGAMFVWALIGAVGYATYSSRVSPIVPAESGDKNAPSPVEQLKLEPVSSEPQPLSATSGGIRWEGTFEAAMQRARVEKKPIMIDFYTDWCTWCKELDRQVYPDKAVVTEADNWIAIKINAEKRPDVASAYGVTGFPTIVFAQPTGKPLLILPGFEAPKDFLATMKEAHSKWTAAA